MHVIFSGFLEEDEKIKRVFRRPFLFALRPFLFWLIIWGGITFALWFFYPRYNLEYVKSYDLNLAWQLTAFIGICFILSPWFGWFVNAIVMTNESVVVVEWPKLFVRRSTRIDLHNLDEITTERVGWRSFFLNYGDVIFNKVNGGAPIIVKDMSCPNRIARVIETYREWSIDQKNFTEESALKGLLSHVVKRHVGETGQPHRRRRYDRYDTEHNPQEVIEETGELVEEPVRVVHTREIKRGKPVTQSDRNIEIEKELDDTGGIDIDL